MPAYLIVDVGPVHDERAYAQYVANMPANIRQAGGEYLARGGPVDVLEGNWTPTRVVVVKFESMEAVRRWWASPDYAELKSLRQRSADARMIVVDGLALSGSS
jgi:uncharacterized protein (DUF1330 family)